MLKSPFSSCCNCTCFQKTYFSIDGHLKVANILTDFILFIYFGHKHFIVCYIQYTILESS